MRMISACARSSASSRTSAGISSPPDSTIVRPSFVPTTTRSRVLCSSLSCNVGLTTNSPSIWPMRTAPTGPMKGSGEIINAAEAPLMQRMSCGVTMSAERTDRAVDQPGGQDRPLRRAALALEETAGDLPGGVHALFDVDGEREEVRALARLRPPLCRGEHHRLARAHDDRAVRLLGELAGLEGDFLAAHGHADRLRLTCWIHSFLHSASVEEWRLGSA